jgi:RNA polymerase sigma-70 factor (ECF subfamily)
MENREIELIKAAKAGNTDAMAALFEDYEQPLLQRCYCLFQNCKWTFGDRLDPKDLAGETWVCVLDSLDNYDPKIGRFINWVYGIAQHVFTNAVKKEYNYQNLMSISADTVAIKDNGLEEEERWQIILEAVKALPDKYREVIIGFYMDGLSCSQIAESLGISVSTVKTRLTRGRQMMKKYIQSHWEEYRGIIK